MVKVAIVTNIPAPYRVDLYNYLHENVTQYDFNIIYTSENESNRAWVVNEEKLVKSYILKSKVIKLKEKIDDRYIHIPGTMLKILNQINPDVVIAMEYNPAAIQCLAWCKQKKKKFIHLTDGTLSSEKNINVLQKFLRKFICEKSDAFIASSTKAKEKLMYWGAPEEKIFLSFLTVNIDDYIIEPSREDDEFVILFVGRLVRGKGLHLLFDALSKIEGNYKLIIAGDGPEERELREQAGKLGILQNISFKGFCDMEQLKKLYSESNLFVLPTLNDCFGLVILEAMCASLPVITTIYADGAPDLIINNKTGFIIDPKNTEEFSRIVQRFIDEKTLVETIGKFAKERVDLFRFENVVNGYIEAIENSLDE